jgi:uncharacterized protein YdaU (DUF1376 family)
LQRIEGGGHVKSPAFQFYSNDFLGGKIATYELEEIGLYSVLLAFDWSLTGLPLDDEKLAKLARVSVRKFRVLWQTVGENFVERDGRYYNPRLELERVRQTENRAKRSMAAHSRWNAHADANALHLECPPSPTPSSSAVELQQHSAAPEETRLLDRAPEAREVVVRFLDGTTEVQRMSWVGRLHAVLDRPPHPSPAELRDGLEDMLTKPREQWGPAMLRAFVTRVRNEGAAPRIVRSAEPDAGEAAWSAVLDLLPAWQRREVTAERHAQLDPATRRGLSAIGGFAAIQSAPTDKRTWIKRDFLAAYRATPHHAGAA